MNLSQILVIGDIILDEYWFGDTNRISPEAPIPVVNIKSKDFRLGGAGNVALNLSQINSNILLISSVGKDSDGKIIEKVLKDKKIKFYLNKNNKAKSIKKLRIFSDHYQMMRLDFEDEKIAYKLELNKKIRNEINKSKIVVLSDYGKGTLQNIKKIIKFAKKKSKLIIIDPKGYDYEIYKYASIITPNIKEFTNIVGEVRNQKQLIKKAKKLLNQYKFTGILITQGKEGMTYVSKNNTIQKKSLAQNVYDVTGAGDTVIATFSAYLNLGKSLDQSIDMANIAASTVIKKIGTSVINRSEIEKIYESQNNLQTEKFYKSTSLLIKKIQRLKLEKKKIIMTNGCFDVVHAGHIHLLEEAKKLGDYLIVAINSDKYVKSLKGKNRPIHRLKARIKVLEALSCVDFVVVFDDFTPLKIIRLISPDILVKGSDYKIKNIVGADLVKSNKGQVKIIKFKKGFSTTKLLEKI